MATVSLIFGILSIILAWFGYSTFLGLILAIVGIILAANARKSQPSGIATAGLVLCIIGIILCGITALSCVLCTACGAAAFNML